MKPFRTLSRTTILDHSRFLRVEQHAIALPDGNTIPDWTWVVTPDFVNVAALTEDGEWLCFRQTKYAVDGTSLAPVGGYIDAGEEPLTAAKRELREETGYEAPLWTPIGAYAVDSNRGCGTAHFFIAEGARQVAAPDADDLEEMQLMRVSTERIRVAIKDNEIKTLPWVAIFALALQLIGDKRRSVE